MEGFFVLCFFQFGRVIFGSKMSAPGMGVLNVLVTLSLL